MAAIGTDTETSLHQRFPIISYDATNTLRQIHNITNNFSGINPAYIGKMMETIHKRPITWVGTLDAPTDIGLIKQIIGKNGLHLKSFTNKCCVDLIWHDRLTNTFIVWGNKNCIISALRHIKRQIKRFLDKQSEDLKVMEDIMSTMNSLDMKSNLSRSREEEDIEMGEPERKKMKCEY